MATVKSIIQDWLNEGRVAWISSQGLHPFALLDRRVDALSLSILTHVVQDDSIPKDATKEPDAPDTQDFPLKDRMLDFESAVLKSVPERAQRAMSGITSIAAVVG